jgi:hypothetical protein
MDYDRRQAAIPRMDQVLHKPAEADEALGEAFVTLVSFKQSMDEMEEIPPYLHGIYDQVMKAMSAVGSARQHTAQLRFMVQKHARQIGR